MGLYSAAHVPAHLPKSINVRESTLRAVKEEQERGVKRAREDDDHDASEARKKAASHPVGPQTARFQPLDSALCVDRSPETSDFSVPDC